MPQPAPSYLNLLVGAGVLFVDRFDTNNNRTGWKHMGNIDQLAIQPTPDIIKKYSSMDPSKPLYDQLNRRLDMALKITASEITPENAALSLMGTTAVYTQPATPVVGEALFATTVPGAYVSTALLGPISAVTVKFGATSGVLGTDYAIIDATAGLIQILPGTILTGAVTINYTPTAIVAAGNAVTLSSSLAPLITCAFKFVGNPTRGRRRIVEIWKASVTPDGAHSLITDDYGNLVINGAVLVDSVNHPTSPLFSDLWFPVP
jgi:hypothetical protein